LSVCSSRKVFAKKQKQFAKRWHNGGQNNDNQRTKAGAGVKAAKKREKQRSQNGKKWGMALAGASMAATLACLAPSALAQGAGVGLSGLPAPFLALQPMAQAQRQTAPDGAQLELLDLNPSVGRWYELSAREPGGATRHAHLDAGALAGRARLSLAADGLVVEATGSSRACPLRSAAERDAVFSAAQGPFSALGCGVWARGSARGSKSALEAATDALRSAGPAGEAIINIEKNLFPQSGDEQGAADGAVAAAAQGGPAPASLPNAPGAISAPNLALRTQGGGGSIKPGAWMRAADVPGAWVSVASPQMAGGASSALVYLLAIDLAGMSGEYEVGVDHPRLDWSDRAPQPHPGPGPDGFASVEPLRREGVVPPWAQPRVQMVFSGGFKREHSAFKRGPRAEQNHGSHYGFAEAGVQLSALQPGLATIWQRAGEPLRMGPWSAQEASRGVEGLLFARQNGLPLVVDGAPGSDLSPYSATGNWSGNHEGKPETMRSAACLIEQQGRSYLAYAVFSSAEPQEMAKTLLRYGCRQAMQLDMNAPELTYAALVSRDASGAPRAEPLLSSMSRGAGGGRFVSAPDTRDFFYWSRR
jgi:hypothetical protein